MAWCFTFTLPNQKEQAHLNSSEITVWKKCLRPTGGIGCDMKEESKSHTGKRCAEGKK
jgi:hypothetical protein